MKLRALFLIFIFGMAMASVSAETCMTVDELVQERIEVRADFAAHRTEKIRVSMDAVIEYLDDEENKDVSLLKDTKEVFLEKAQEIETTDSLDSFKNWVNELETLVMTFREEVRETTKDMDLAKEAVNDSLNKKESYLQELLETAYENGIQHQKNRYDSSVCRLQNRIDNFDALDHDMSDAQLKLDNYNKYQDEIEETLQQAYDSCKKEPLHECDTTQKENYVELREEIREGFIKTRTFIGLEITQEVIDRTEELIEKMEEKDIDVSDFRTEHDEIQDDVDLAVDYYLDGNYEDSVDMTSEFRGDIRDLRQDMREEWVLSREGLRGEQR